MSTYKKNKNKIMKGDALQPSLPILGLVAHSTTQLHHPLTY